MNRILVEIYLPPALAAYDVRIPADVQLYKSIALVGQALSRLSGGLYTADRDAVVLQRDNGAILNINMTPWELGIRNGSRLMLI